MNYLATFLEGIITFISPCLLPMIPVYISYFAGNTGEAQTEGQQNTKRVLVNALFFVLGFTVTFVVLGVFAGVLGSFLLRYKTALNIICGLIVLFFGLNFIGVFRLKLFSGAGGNLKLKTGGVISSFVFGLVFSISWTPCVGAFLGSALALASQQGSALEGLLLLLSYSVGLGIPFVLSAVLLNSLKSAFDAIKRHYKVINIVCGSFLILIGILMMTGLLDRLLGLLS